MMATGKDKTRTPAPMTARELLVEVLGKEHTLHSVVKWDVAPSGALRMKCSCGGLGTTLFSPESLRALRNMRNADVSKEP